VTSQLLRSLSSIPVDPAIAKEVRSCIKAQLLGASVRCGLMEGSPSPHPHDSRGRSPGKQAGKKTTRQLPTSSVCHESH
jgi:hypothetical protein